MNPETEYPEVERAVLAALIRDPDGSRVINLGLTPALFTSPERVAAFQAIINALAEGETPDAATLTAALDGATLIELETSLSSHASSANLEPHVQLLKKAAAARLAQAKRAEIAAAVERRDEPGRIAKLAGELQAIETAQLDEPDASASWGDPFPLPTELPPVAAFLPEILPDSLHPWIMDIAERLQCPPDFPAVGAMVGLAALVGRKVGIRPKRHDDWLVVPNLWGVIVGRPGVLKSPALQESMKPLFRLEVEAKNQHELAKADAEATQAVAEARRKVNDAKIKEAIRKGTGDAYEIARLAIGDSQDAPTRRRYLVNDASVEKLGELLNENPNGLMVFRDELLGFLYPLDRDGQEGARQFYLEAWNGSGRFTYDRIGRGTVDIEACCLSILGSIQPGPLQDYLATAPDDGLMQRFQLAVWPDLEQSWRNVDRWPDRDAKDQAWSVFARLDGLAGLAVGAVPGNNGDIPSLRFAPDAQAEFTAWRTALENRLRVEELPPAFETCLAKYRSLIPSLALLIHLADTPEGGPVSLPALIKACAWGEYLESHARRIYAAHTTPGLLGAVRLAEKIQAGALSDPFALRDVYRPGWSRLATAEQAQAAVNVLVDHEWLRPATEKTKGRPRASYTINPQLRGAA